MSVQEHREPCGNDRRGSRLAWLAAGLAIAIALAGLTGVRSAPAAPATNFAAGSLVIPMDVKVDRGAWGAATRSPAKQRIRPRQRSQPRESDDSE
jgi:hypothetical protein